MYTILRFTGEIKPDFNTEVIDDKKIKVAQIHMTEELFAKAIDFTEDCEDESVKHILQPEQTNIFQSPNETYKKLLDFMIVTEADLFIDKVLKMIDPDLTITDIDEAVHYN